MESKRRAGADGREEEGAGKELLEKMEWAAGLSRDLRWRGRECRWKESRGAEATVAEIFGGSNGRGRCDAGTLGAARRAGV